MNRYAVKEVFDTLQGEGRRTGMRSVFVRFAGCNLWDGNPLHRDQGEGACARWCDTDFFKGKVMDVTDLLELMNAAWPPSEAVAGERWCVLTGGEPLLQVDGALLDALHDNGWLIACETNGTIDPKFSWTKFDHLTVSPKLGTHLALMHAHELKVVLPGGPPSAPGWTDTMLEELAAVGRWDWKYVQPQDQLLDSGSVELTLLKRGPLDAEVEEEAEQIAFAAFGMSVARCRQFIQSHSGWGLSQQTHKALNLP